MKKLGQIFAILVLSTLFVTAGNIPRAHALFTMIPFEFNDFDIHDLDEHEGCDDCNFGNVPLGFSATIGGDTYTNFWMDSNGFVELFKDGGSSHLGTTYGSITGTDRNLIQDIDDDDDDSLNVPTATYLLAGFDDLDSGDDDDDDDDGGFFGYKLFSDSAAFYYHTETYDDEDDDDDEFFMNSFEVILNDDGTVQWNFNEANYEGYDYDLYSGLYFGNSETLLTLYEGVLPEEKSWLYTEPIENHQNVIPEPATMLLFGSGIAGMFF